MGTNENYMRFRNSLRPVFSSYSIEQLENFRQMLTEHMGQMEIRRV
ncbi:MAG: hypothetical protein MR936_00700 [Eubacterium sp.]|nr:hypothetical protein [Eubacterium sp.]